VAAPFINLLSNIGNNNYSTCIDPAAPALATSDDQVLYSAGPTITEADLDLSSAANPATLSNIIYGTLGWSWDWCLPTFVAVGGSYEFTSINTAVSRWNVWGKFGISF
jgi:hypothetical protein